MLPIWRKRNRRAPRVTFDKALMMLCLVGKTGHQVAQCADTWSTDMLI